MRSRTLQLVMIVICVLAIASIVSHSVMAWLHIRTSFGRQWMLGPVSGGAPIYMAGSSLAGDGIAWKQVSEQLNWRIEGWGVAGSSPCEWEQFQMRAREAKTTYIVISSYDLNEYSLCDFRAEVVPLEQTARDLWQSRMDWAFSKNVLSLYPLTYLRKLFPTAGRSDGVMVGGREKLKLLVHGILPMESEAGPSLALGESDSSQDVKSERISNWSEGRMLRRLASMRSGCQGKHAFNGPKSLALYRILRQAQEQGDAVVVVLPVSLAYTKEFLTPEVMREFEERLTHLQHSLPQTRWIRLDQSTELTSDDYYWDLVHMNSYGQKIATEAFLARLSKFSSLP